MQPGEFITKWRQVVLTERSAAQQHFLDLCDLLEHPRPAALDPTGDKFTFEKGAAKESGGKGWADVWKRGCFGWEYKGKHKDLDAAYQQLLQYRQALNNPPLLVVCDMDHIVVHTNFTATASETFTIPLQDLGEPRNLEILRHVFFEPEKLHPVVTSEVITAEAARRLGNIAQALRDRGHDPLEVAHFLDRIIFCMFAEDIDLLPVPESGEPVNRIFSLIVRRFRQKPDKFRQTIAGLFEAMADGGAFGADDILYFNGDLFRDGPILELTRDEIGSIHQAAQLDWSKVEPSIFGTLFERGMDPDKRAQIGAHYTGQEDIEMLVEPVLMQPLRREWDAVKETVAERLTAAGKSKGNPRTKKGVMTKAKGEAGLMAQRFLTKLRQVKVLDPACGSGNFLYVALRKLKDLEREVIEYGMAHDLTTDHLPLVGPHQMHGIEINPYAFGLAQLVVWIGHLQWMHAYGYGIGTPVLNPMAGNFQCKDAILDLTDPENPKEPEWPKVDYIVGNPPFLGDKLMRGGLGDEYVETLRSLYRDRIPGQSDLCCYWFEKARAGIGGAQCSRAGLLATQGIRGGANRRVLEKIKDTGDIFFAVSDRTWVLDGANVHISMVGFDDGTEQARNLDGREVDTLHPNLAGGSEDTVEVTRAERLPENTARCFLGVMKAGSFDISEETAMALLKTPDVGPAAPSNVLRPRFTAQAILQRTGGDWIIDFGCDMPLGEACLYEHVWTHVDTHVRPKRLSNRRKRLAERWWIHGEARPGLRRALTGLPRFIVSPEVSKHRIFVWLEDVALADHQTRAFAQDDDYFFGVLHSRVHETWARAQGTQLRERESGFRYTPTSCFETFPFPWAPGEEPVDDPLVQAIAAAAKELDELRTNWLNPPEWTQEEILEFPGGADGPWARYVHDPDDRGIGTVRYPRLVPRDEACANKLKKRTLTNLYNERPTWLDQAHRKLDRSVFAAYAWPPDLTDEQLLEKLLELNLARASEEADT